MRQRRRLLTGAVYAEAEKTKEPLEPGIRHRSTRYKQSFDPLKTEVGLARPLVELDPRHALVPSVCSQHDALQSADAPSAARDRAMNISPGSDDV
jgi:hypothetical protein